MYTNLKRPLGALAVASILALTGCSANKDSRAADQAAETTAANTDAAPERTNSKDWSDSAQSPSQTRAQSAEPVPPVVEAAPAGDTVAAAAADTTAGAAAAPARRESAKQRDWDRAPETAPPATYPSATYPPTTTAAGISPNIVARDVGVNPEVDTRDDTKSTFAMDVDTGSYTLARSLVQQGQLPQLDAVRAEEFVNYFDQQYRSPAPGETFVIHVDGTAVPFLDSTKRVIRVGIQGRRVDIADRKPLRLTFVVDNSGSMQENGKLEIVKNAMTTMLDNLRADDQISIVGFSDNARVLLAPIAANRRSEILGAISSMSPDSSTNAEAGLRLGYEQAQAMYDGKSTNRVILLSDGVANVGPSGPEAILTSIGDYARRDIDLNTVGVGTSSYNDAMMERLADTGNGFYVYIDNQAEANRVFSEKFVGTVETIARNAKVQVQFNADAVATYRLLGFENRAVADRDFRNDNVKAGEIGAGHAVTALYEVTLTERAARASGGTDNTDLATVNLRWEEPNGKVKERKAQLRSGVLATDFRSADDHLRLDIVATAYADVLREGSWSRLMDLTTVAANAQRLVQSDGPFVNNPQVTEFADLTQQAARLRPNRGW
jgi:Ca-activated chloride channel homolog